ncbi:MAG: precorrin-6y C5,15-methyltransferase (decarboxylating) subunit CbiE [Desulfobacterales bacterium]|nr:precorrin-6y C5,15-methyltransferase (decarboxylating) subunit CbiE [Desulfobacterales bacterium]
MKHRILVVGMGMCRDDLCQKHLAAVQSADFLVGTERHLGWFSDHPGRRRPIDAPLPEVLAEIEKQAETARVAVLASGDPLFFGIGATLIKHFGAQNVTIHSNVSSMAAAFSRIGKPWHNAEAVSLHARDGGYRLNEALASGRPVFLLTDPKNSPDQVARMVMERAGGAFAFRVFECLGMENERIRRLDPAVAANERFLNPNAVILEPEESPAAGSPICPGAPEDHYLHCPAMITKAEVRAVVLSKLRLSPEHVFWDLGAASGAVAIEASLFVTSGRIVAVEKNPDRAEHIRKNAAKYAPGRIEIVENTLPGAMDELPDPDRVFIGGGGRDIAEIVRRAASRLRPGGRIVANIVILETLNQCLDALGRQDFAVDTVQVQVNRSAPMPGGIRLEARNPVFVVSAEKPV